MIVGSLCLLSFFESSVHAFKRHKDSRSDSVTMVSKHGSKVVNTKFSEDVDGEVTQLDPSLNNSSQTSLRPSLQASSQQSSSPPSPALKKGEEEHVRLTWRSWLVVFITCFAQLAQVFVVAGAGQNIAFIARDLGDQNLAGWIIREYDKARHESLN